MNTGKNTPVILSYSIFSKNGLKLDFNEIPFQHCCNNFPLSKEEMSITNSEIEKLKSKTVIVNADKRTGFTFLVFLPKVKKDGSHRMILNLKNLNKFICYRHFKMESIQNVLNVIKKDAFTASVDLKNAFYSVQLATHYQKHLKFLQVNILSLHACQMGIVLPSGFYKDHKSTIFSTQDVGSS